MTKTQILVHRKIMYAQAMDYLKMNVMLNTAIAPVKQDQYTTVENILSDEGSQRSFVTDKPARERNIQRTTTETIQLSAFGDKQNTSTSIKSPS